MLYNEPSRGKPIGDCYELLFISEIGTWVAIFRRGWWLSRCAPTVGTPAVTSSQVTVDRRRTRACRGIVTLGAFSSQFTMLVGGSRLQYLTALACPIPAITRLLRNGMEMGSIAQQVGGV